MIRLIKKAANNTDILRIINQVIRANINSFYRFDKHELKYIHGLNAENFWNKYIKYILAGEKTKYIKQLKSLLYTLYKNNQSYDINQIINYYDKHFQPIMFNILSTNIPADKIKNLINTIQPVKKQSANKRIFLNKIIKDIVTTVPKQYIPPILDVIDKINIDILKQNSLDKFIQHYINIMYNLYFTEYDISVLTEKLIKSIKYVLKRENKNFNEYEEDINYLMDNKFDLYLKYACNKIFPDMRTVRQVLQHNTNIKNQVLRAYNNVKTWLAQDYSDLELANLRDDDIHIMSNMESGILADCNVVQRRNQLFVVIRINESVTYTGNTNLSSIIYHELIHAIKGQAQSAKEMQYADKGISDAQYQAEAHNDDIWNKGSEMINKHTHLDINSNINTDLESNMNDILYKLNQFHEASLICYNCGWFKIYPKWDNDCELARDNQFICPKCHTHNVKLIYPSPGEKALIDDAFAHLHYTTTEQKRYKSADIHHLLHK